jgi:hypothetical protein
LKLKNDELLPTSAFKFNLRRYTKEVHPSGEILKLASFCPWKEHLFELEAERGVHPLPKYCLFEDGKGGWRWGFTQSPCRLIYPLRFWLVEATTTLNIV